jgi:hypothetical protein
MNTTRSSVSYIGQKSNKNSVKKSVKGRSRTLAMRSRIKGQTSQRKVKEQSSIRITTVKSVLLKRKESKNHQSESGPRHLADCFVVYHTVWSTASEQLLDAVTQLSERVPLTVSGRRYTRSAFIRSEPECVQYTVADCRTSSTECLTRVRILPSHTQEVGAPRESLHHIANLSELPHTT